MSAQDSRSGVVQTPIDTAELERAIAVIKDATPAMAPWTDEDFSDEGDQAPSIDRHIATILNAVVSGELVRSDLCASGQVRALDVDDLAQIIRVVDGNNTLGAGELAEAILEAMPAPRIVGTPAPSAATPTAQEAVAWRCKDYADGWILYGNKAQAELYQACTGCLMEALYVHPPQLSETVAEAVAALEALPRSTYDCGTQWVRLEDAIAALRALKGGER